MATNKATKGYRRQLTRRLNRQTAGYIWTLSPAAEQYFKADGVDIKWARRGYAIKIAELASELLDIERELS